MLAIMAAHNKEVRDEVFDRVDFMMELRFALEVAQKRCLEKQLQKRQTDSEIQTRRKLIRIIRTVLEITDHVLEKSALKNTRALDTSFTSSAC